MTTAPPATDHALVLDLVGQLLDTIPHTTHHDHPTSALPLCGVHLEATGHTLYAIGTDLHTLAATRRYAGGIGTWECFLPAEDVRALLALARACDVRNGRVRFEETAGPGPDRLHVRLAGHTLALPACGPLRFDWRAKIAEALAVDPAPVDAQSIPVDQLRRWTRQPAGTRLHIWDADGTAVITRYDDPNYIGLHGLARTAVSNVPHPRTAALDAWTHR
ncbi:hypothetical protein [Embleya hyalina]|uniref:DNA polymerase III subunit beta n=1 Tax=Embleya hyalina TaxID=516124 RepID=A0A401Z3Z9_9ACTN|nr:hypothetical protein [Embleya hyalina]GCE01574.1 hypothetical protein EHYA_09340 [Embleya hyalina]